MALEFVKGRSTETEEFTEGQCSNDLILNLGYNHTQYIFLTNEDAGKDAGNKEEAYSSKTSARSTLSDFTPDVTTTHLAGSNISNGESNLSQDPNAETTVTKDSASSQRRAPPISLQKYEGFSSFDDDDGEDEKDSVCKLTQEINDSESHDLKDRDILKNYPYSISKCYLMHAVSKLYLRKDGDDINLGQLQRDDQRYVFQRGFTGGMELDKTSPFYRRPANVICINDVIGARDYLTVRQDGVLRFQCISEPDERKKTVPTSKDARYFYLIHTGGTTVCLMSTVVDNHCLAYNGHDVVVKRITDERLLTKDPEIQFKIKK